MAASLDTYLKTLSSSYYLKNDSAEVKKIDASIAALFKNLNTEFGSRINRKFVFGSYDRDTILPRSIDEKSDVDIMIVFNHSVYERTPETYRTWLKSFAEKYYKDRYGSEVVKTHPTVTIRLNNIYYDLVPAKETAFSFLFPNNLDIPDTNNNWRITDPNDVKKNLVDANIRYNYIVRPIIRLLKAWNCTNGYPYDSYDLERDITTKNYHGDNIQTGFFYASKYLRVNSTRFQAEKVNSLIYNLEKVQECLDLYDVEHAKHWLHRVLP
ncbi:MAG: SMODS domain-containing nucleotidyltransferase [Flavipsychrobacter sp.]